MNREIRKKLKELRENKFIKEKEYGDISSFNFSRKAFYHDVWNEQTIKTRGLFVNTGIGKVVARSFDKFFEIDDERFYTRDTLKEEIVFPVEVFRKENGYLGMLGYDAESGKLLFCTKSNIGGDFARNFERIVRKMVSEENLENIKEYLKAGNCTMVFEVIDPVNDPHIIEYKDEGVVLLDIVKNNFEFECIPYEELMHAAAHVNLPYKKRCRVLNSFDELKELYLQTQQYGYTDDGEPIEGYVIRDTANHMYKIKTYYYRFWKRMRQVKERFHQYGKVKEGLREFLTNDWERAVLDYLVSHEDKGIIEMRKEMEKEGLVHDTV